MATAIAVLVLVVLLIIVVLSRNASLACLPDHVIAAEADIADEFWESDNPFRREQLSRTNKASSAGSDDAAVADSSVHFPEPAPLAWPAKSE